MPDYPWTPQFAAAMLEINVDKLPTRISIAECALSQRLAASPPLDSEERMRITDAQHALEALKREFR